ncbi:MAG TPA: GMC family oxidoreductase [Candidatus Limnocylindria bacterium]|nr:GMC family oxidoreductase [Candidatus Limnocylindria bacterium]
MADRARALAALCDSFVPGDGGLPAASALGVPERLRREVSALGRPAFVRELDQLLDTIESPLLNLALGCGPVRFSALTQPAREDYLRRWATSPIALKRRAFQVMKRLILLYTYGAETSPYARAMGFVAPPLDEPAPPSALRFRALGPGETVDADVCVIGSGAGGAVVAAELARSGRRVIVLERARPRAEPAFVGHELDGYAGLFYDRGIAATADRAIALLAGSALGGGTIVNWSTSLRISAVVAEEWRAAGIEDGLDPHYDAVALRLGVTTEESARNGPNAVLERGLAALGRSSATIARNVRGCGDCGPCTFGCRRGAKQSTMRTFLADACAAGADIAPGAEARRVVVERGRVTGVDVRVDGGSATVRAPLVALAGGALLSPAVLLRSGIAGAQAGRSLHLHPVTVTGGVYDEDLGGTWAGVPQSVLGDAWESVDGAHGFRLELPQAFPGILAASFPWWGADAHRARSADARRIAPFIAIVRDHGTGRVRVDPQGEPVVEYRTGVRERRLLERAMIESARVHAAAGARQIFTLHTPSLERPAAALDDLVAEIARRGVTANRVTLFSAHQMSSCRIGRGRSSSVADPDGQVWDTRGLYVADASAFPSASGVNPMLTVMALARRTAQRMRAA